MSDVISLGMVGVGGWGRFVVRNFSQNPNCNLKYICDADEKLLARQAVLYPLAALTTDFQTILDDDQIDAVAIVTPAPTHYALAKSALLAGKHVYVEKPMTLTAELPVQLFRQFDQFLRMLSRQRHRLFDVNVLSGQ